MRPDGKAHLLWIGLFQGICTSTDGLERVEADAGTNAIKLGLAVGDKMSLSESKPGKMETKRGG